METLIKIVLNALAVMAAAYLLPGIAVENFLFAALAALVLALINATLKPLLVILTLPVTIFTLGLFYFAINALMVMLAGWIVPGFSVSGFFSALLFSLIFTAIKFLLDRIFGSEEGKKF
ncbi:MAG: phage holin family protein [Patescibacteria group bacterium]|jgi:putative membrane protein